MWISKIFSAVFEKQPFRKISEIKLPSEAAIGLHFSILLLGTYSEILWKIIVRECDLFVIRHLTLSNFEPLLQKFKYFITALINAEQLLLWIPSRNLFCVLKIWGNSMLAGYNFTKNFPVDVAGVIFRNV